ESDVLFRAQLRLFGCGIALGIGRGGLRRAGGSRSGAGQHIRRSIPSGKEPALRTFLAAEVRRIMLKTRVIPVLFLKRGFLVRSELFATHQNLGNPTTQVSRFNTWDVDELIYIDITPDERYDIQREDLGGAGFSN